MPYIDPDLLSDEGVVAQAMLQGIQDSIPGWDPFEGHIETALCEAIAMTVAGVAAEIKTRARIDYAGFGHQVLGVTRHSEQVATASTDWTFSHTNGGFIPAGSLVVMTPPGGDPVTFATTMDVTIPAGTNTAPGVQVAAIEAGPEANGLTGPASTYTTITGTTGVTMTTTSVGGADQEPLEDYVDRVADAARRLHLTPITTRDFAGAALDHPRAARAMAVNLLNPATTTYPATPTDEGHIAVCVVDAAGQPLTAPQKAEVQTLLDGDPGPLNVAVHVIDPTATTINVQATVQAAPGVAADALAGAVQAAITAYLDPSTWGYDRSEPGRWRAPATPEDRTVRDFDIATIAAEVPGVAGVDAATVNNGRSVILTGYAPLAKAGTVQVTVT